MDVQMKLRQVFNRLDRDQVIDELPFPPEVVLYFVDLLDKYGAIEPGVDPAVVFTPESYEA